MKQQKPKFKNLEHLQKWAKNAKSDWEVAYKDNYDRASTCSKFLFGIDEWDPTVVAARNAQDKETITSNFCNKFYRQIKSELLEVNVSLDIESNQDLDDEQDLLDKELIEQIMLSSDNLKAFKLVLDDCLINGFGVLEVVRAYEDERSTNEILKVRRFKNIQDTFFDLTSADETYSKSRYCGYVSTVSYDNLVLNYPQLRSKKNGAHGKMIDVWDFFWKESYPIIYYSLGRGKPYVMLKDLPFEMLQDKDSLNKKKRMMPMICRARFTDEEFLIKPEVMYRGDLLPLIYWPILTQHYFKEQNRVSYHNNQSGIVTTPYIYHFLGLQQAYNYSLSQATTLVAQATGRKYFLTKEQAKGDLERWMNINSHSGAIFYSADSDPVSSGQQGQAPVQIQIDSSEPIPATLINFIQVLQATFNDLSGMTAAQQGAPDNTVSGAAADIKVSQANLTNRQIMTAHIYAIDTVGRLLQQWIPQVYKERRVYRLPTGRIVVLNDQKYDSMRGLIVKNDVNDLLSVLKVHIGAGISTRQERKNAMQSLINIMSTTQNSLALLGPVLAMNWEGDGKDILEKLLMTLLSKPQYDLLKGKIDEDQFFADQEQQAQAQADPKAELEQQKITQQIENITANTEAAKARAQKAIMDTAYTEKQIKEPLNLEKSPEYGDLAKKKQIAQIKELQTREKINLHKLAAEYGTNNIPSK